MEVSNLPSASILSCSLPRIANNSHGSSRMVAFSSRSDAPRFRLQMAKGCKTCGGKGAVECPGCKGTGRNKKNGNIFERWKCFECQGFGLKSCPKCGKGGLTPEQRGER